MKAHQERAKSLFLNAVDIAAGAQRQAYLDAACAGDEILRAEIEQLLWHHEHMNDFLDATAGFSPNTGTQPPEAAGTCIGPYKLLQRIGEGGMGIVWMAEQQEPVRRKVALKIIKPGMDSCQVIARFEAERQALALMDHQNIARVLDAGTTDHSRPFFVMELIHGIPITQYCDDNQLTLRERLELFVPVCQAIQHAHQKGIIHRDVKPSNVLVTRYDGKPAPKVIDFGVAKAVEQRLTEQTLFTQYGTIIGTFEYMSPEQAEMSALGVDTRSDIYSLGVLLYELLTGTPPLERQRLRTASYAEIVRLIREEEPVKPSTRLNHSQTLPAVAAARKMELVKLSKLVRGELDWIVMKALEKDRNRRYQTANGLARDVQSYLNDEPVQACPPSAWYRFRKFARRNKTRLVVVAGAFLALAGLAAGIGWSVRDRMARGEALDQTVARSLEEATPLIEQGKWPEALAVVERADKLLTAAGRTERPTRLVHLHNELRLVQRLEDINREPKQERLSSAIASGQEKSGYSDWGQRNSAEEDFYGGREQDKQFAEEFRKFDIDIEALEPAEAAARIRETSIRPAIIQSLDAWAAMRKRARGEGDAFWKKVIEVAKQADPDDWRNRCREALLRRDRPGLEKLAAALPVREVPPATVYMLGHALKDLGAGDKAMAVLREAHRHHPDDFWLNDALGGFSKDCYDPPRYEDALRYYSMTAALRPRSWHTHCSVAGALELKGATGEAMAEYTKAIELAPQNPQVWKARVLAHWRLKQHEKTIADCSKALELDPKLAWALDNRGWAYVQLHQYDKALSDLNKAIELNPKYAWAWNSRGCAYLNLNQYGKALADFSKAGELDLKFAAPWLNRGLVHDRLHQFDNALVNYSKAIELDPKNVLARDKRGFVYYNLRHYDKSLLDYSEAIKLDPNSPVFWFRRGNVYYKLHQFDKALADYSKAIELDPKYVEAWHKRCHVYSHLNQSEKAIAGWNKAIELDPMNTAACNDLAWFLANCPDPKLRDGRKALQLARKAVELDPRDNRTWNTLGAAHYRCGESKTAVEALKKGMDLSKGGDSFDWFILAMAHRQLGDKKQSLQWYNRAVQWMDKNQPKDEDLRRLRKEAAGLLGVETKSK